MVELIVWSSGMAMVLIANRSWQPLCNGLVKGADEGFYTSLLYEWELIPEYWVNIILSVCLCHLPPYKLLWGLYLDWLFVVLFVKLHRIFCDISLKILIVCNPMFYPFSIFSTYISYWFLHTLLMFFPLLRSCVCRILDLYHVLMYVCRLYWFLLPTFFLLVSNSNVCRNYIPKWNNMFVVFAQSMVNILFGCHMWLHSTETHRTSGISVGILSW